MKIVIYSKDPCPYCVHAKRFLENRNLPYEEIDLTDKPEEIMAMKKKWGWSTVPIIIIDDKLIGGYVDLKAYAEAGHLD